MMILMMMMVSMVREGGQHKNDLHLPIRHRCRHRHRHRHCHHILCGWSVSLQATLTDGLTHVSVAILAQAALTVSPLGLMVWDTPCYVVMVWQPWGGRGDAAQRQMTDSEMRWNQDLIAQNPSLSCCCFTMANPKGIRLRSAAAASCCS